jgi:hypothetical protein
MLLVPNVYAGRPRLDVPEGESEEVGDCYVDGYDAGFANEYDKDRAEVCEEIGKDWYNMSWENGCMDSGLTKQDCDNIKEGNDSDDLGDREQLKEENTQDCYDDGYEDGQIHPFDRDMNSACQEYGYHTYYDGFIAGCESAGNTRDICETFTDAS